MQLQGRRLQIEMRGDDMKLLHRELLRLDLPAIPDDEVQRGYFGDGTYQAVVVFQRRHKLPETGRVEEETARLLTVEISKLSPSQPTPPPPLPPYVVRGQVRRTDGRALAGISVIAYDRDLRNLELLGEAVTGEDGRYEIRYSPERFRRAEKGCADLVLQAFKGKEEELQVNPATHGFDAIKPVETALNNQKQQVFFNAPQEFTVDLIVDVIEEHKVSEYEKLLAELEPLLERTALSELTDDDLIFLTNETGIERIKLDSLHQAAKLNAAEARQLSSDKPFTPIFYGLGRQGMPLDSLSSLLRRRMQALREALEKAIQQNIIPDTDIGAALRRFESIHIRRTLEAPVENDRVNPGTVLKTSRLSDRQQERLLSRLLRHEGTPESLWQALAEDEELGEDAVEEIKTTLQITRLTAGHQPLLAHVQELRQSGHVRSLRELAKFSEADWLAMIRSEAGGRRIGPPAEMPGEDDEAKMKNYAAGIHSRVEDLFPTAAIAAHLERSRLPFGQEMARAFARKTDFDLLRHSVDKTFGDSLPAEVKKEMKRVQRVARVTHRSRHIEALLGHGIDSARRICNTPLRDLRKIKALKEDEYPSLRKKAAQRNDAIAYLSGTLAREKAPDVLKHVPSWKDFVLPSVPPPDMDDLVDPLQPVSLPEMFGSLECCACKHCRSVYSPAAYLVDLLQFVTRHLGAEGGSSKYKFDGDEYNALFRDDRRPDIQHILLNCENTNTQLPYIDLVNEILERAVLGEEGKKLPWPQTTWTEEELAANPENIYREAYDKVLSKVSFPFALPFDLNAVELRAYLAHLGVPRHTLMETFSKEEAPLLEVSIAAEYLQINYQERKLLKADVSPNPSGEKLGPWEFWGLKESDNKVPGSEVNLDWIAYLSDCRRFLAMAELTIDELETLLRQKFVDPAGKLKLTMPNSCSLEGATINFHEHRWATVRIARFLRLWRRLGWTMEELDLALEILAPKILVRDVIIASDPWGRIDDHFLIALSHIHRLTEQLGLSVVEALSLYGEMPTRPHQKGKPSLYAEVFLNKTVTNPNEFKSDQKQPHVVFRLSNLDNANPKKIEDHAPYIAAALGISVQDVLDILAWTMRRVRLIHINEEKPTLSEIMSTLTIEGLSQQYRVAILSRALELKVPHLLSLLDLIEFDFDLRLRRRNPPPPDPNTVVFDPETEAERTLKILNNVKTHHHIQASGFSIPELDYLLRHKLTPETAESSLRQRAVVLDQIRAGLQKIAAETNPAGLSDTKGELLQQKLLLLGWEPERVTKVVGTLMGAETWETPLEALPIYRAFALDDRLQFVPPELDAVYGRLLFRGRMTPQTMKELIPPPPQATDPDLSELDTLEAAVAAYQNFMVALKALSDQQRAYIQWAMSIFVIPDWTVPLVITEDIKFTEPLNKNISYNGKSKELRWRGLFDPVKDKDKLLNAVTFLDEQNTNDYKKAVNDLTKLIGEYTANEAKTEPFITPDDLDALFADDNNPNDPDPVPHIQFVLQKLLPYLQKTLGEAFVKQTLTQTLRLEAGLVDNLLTQWVMRTDGDDVPAIRAFVSDDARHFVSMRGLLREKYVEQQQIEAAFSVQFQTLLRLQKVALVLEKLRIKQSEAAYLFGSLADPQWLDPRDLPISPLGGKASLASLFRGWQRLVDVAQLRDRVGTKEPGLFDLFEMAKAFRRNEIKNSAFAETLVERLGWEKAEGDFAALCDQFGYKKVSAFLDERSWIRVERCFRLCEQMGVSVTKPEGSTQSNALQWLNSTATQQAAQSAKLAARAGYSPEEWGEAALSLQNELRRKRRDALVAYITFQQRWTREQMFDYYLIDSQMEPCMMTSRIKQAISSVQLFVQRIFLRLEWKLDAQFNPVLELKTDEDGNQFYVPVTLTFSSPDEAATEWEWVKFYRVWEANRKVFLYPENWIEPELRDDKTIFFKELENELRQNQLTDEYVEKIYLSYLEKLDQVSNLDIIAQYYDEDKECLHIFGRTRVIPYIYYYRYCDNSDDIRAWSSWEKVNLDIEGNHLLPVVWNRRLYLFWPIFEEGIETKAAEQGSDNSEPKRYWQIRMAWSEYWQNAWSTKKTTKDLITPMRSKLVTYTPSDVEPIYLNEKGGNSRYFYFQLLVNKTTGSLVIQCWYKRADLFRNHAVNVQKVFDRFLIGYEIIVDEEKPPAPKIKLLIDDYSKIWGVNSDGEIEKAWEAMQASIKPLNEWGISLLGSLLGPPAATSIAKERKTVTSKWGESKKLLDAIRKGSELSSKDSTIDLIVEINETKVKTLFSPEAEDFLDSLRSRDLKGAIDQFTFHPSGVIDTEVIDPGKMLNVMHSLGSLENMILEIRPKSSVVQFLGPLYNSGSNDAYSYLASEILWGPVSSAFKLLFPHQAASIWFMPFFYQDNDSTLIIWPSFEVLKSNYSIFGNTLNIETINTYYSVERSYHPFTKLFIQQLNRFGIAGILKPERSAENDIVLYRQKAFSEWEYSLNASKSIKYGYPHKEISFDRKDAYCSYNWEIFFHIPLLIATRLNQDQRFEEAMLWFHYIFDPLSPDPADMEAMKAWKSPWRLRAFSDINEKPETINTQLELLSKDDKELEKEGKLGDRNNIINQIKQWRNLPFKPHLLARMRTSPYMRNVVMKYLDNLIAWGDQLFRHDTIESINEAMQLYILVAEILGPRPLELPEKSSLGMTYADLNGKLDEFSNGWEEFVFIGDFSNLDAPLLYGMSFLLDSISNDRRTNDGHDYWNFIGEASRRDMGKAGDSCSPPLETIISPPEFHPTNNRGPRNLYFCVPPNDKLLSYWDTVADRLFKIRNCQNIEGVERQLALFEPPIDPALLVKAAAAGVDFGSVLDDLSAPSPLYRFQALAQKATELCNEVKSLGAAILSAREKSDAEKLARLRSSQEIGLLELGKEVRKKQVEESRHSLEGLKKSKEVIEQRRNYYRDIEKISEGEDHQLNQLKISKRWQNAAQVAAIAASLALPIPDKAAGKSGPGAHLVAILGGSKTGAALQAVSSGFNALAAEDSYDANLAAIKAGHDRRWSDWKQQEKLADKELKQIDKQIAAAEVRVAIIEKERANHDKQLENAKVVDDYMYSKFTNQELYDWMVGQISGVYFQSYQLAYDLAKRAEKAYRFELGLQNSDFIKFGYWDNLHKGLLAGEQLMFDLKRMEAEYLEQNKREYEITKHISLAMLDPVALIKLRETGQCFVSLPEAIFDLDYPGHYLRRIKSVSLTIPCVTGPYTGVNCTLTLLKSSIRHKAQSGEKDTYARKPEDDTRFTDITGAIQSIVTSSGQNDSGMFEANLRDERYLPFEGAGAISQWRIQLPKDFKAFDYDTISDVVMHMRYTAREGGKKLQDQAVIELKETLKNAGKQGLSQAFSLRHEFPTEWHALMNLKDATSEKTISLPLTADRFPYMFQNLKIRSVEFFVKADVIEDFVLFFSAKQDNLSDDQNKLPFSPGKKISGLMHNQKQFGNNPLTGPGEFHLKRAASAENILEKIEDIFIVCHYSV